MSLRLHIALICFLLAPTSLPTAAQVRIAVAASAGPLMERLSGEYARISGTAIETVTGPSGVLSGQILQGAPFDLLFSADTSYPARIERSGLARSPVRIYAVGRMTLLSRVPPDSSDPLNILLSGEIGRVAVANPALAPYGQVAMDAIAAAGILDAVRTKLIYAESITQVNHFLRAGAVDAALTVLPSLEPDSRGGRVPAGWYATEPGTRGVPQGVVLLGRASGTPSAGAVEFLEYVLSPAGRRVIVEAGYGVP